MESVDSRRTSTPLTLAGIVGVVALWFAFALPFPGLPVAPGIDGSYAWAINALAAGEAAEPRGGVAFPYGPLGYVAVPLPLAGRIETAAPVRLGLHLLTSLALLPLALAAGPRRAAAFVAANLAITAFVAPTWEAGLGIVVPLLLAADLAGRRSVRGAAPLAAGVIVLFALIKLSLALAAAAFAGAWLLARGASPRTDAPRGATRDRLEFLAVGALASVIAGWLAFDGSAAAGTFLRGSAELAAGFATAMSLPVAPLAIAAGAALLVLPLGLALAARRSGDPLLAFYLALVLPFWLWFRHGFVRPDVHVGLAVAPSIATLSIALLLARDRRSFRRALVGLLCAGLLGFGALSAAAHDEAPSAWRVISGRRALAAGSAWLDLGGHRERLRAAGERLLAPERWPEPERAAVASAPSVDVLPWNLSAIAANGFEWRPSPLLQLYHAWTPWLDRRAAAHFAAHGADRLLVHDGVIDGRGLFWEAPETWRAIAAAYEPLESAAPEGWIVLARRTQAARWEPRSVGRIRMEHGEWLATPDLGPGEVLVGDLRLEATWTGRLRAALWRVEPVELEFETAGGRTGRGRIIPSTAASGLRLDVAPQSVVELEALLRSGAVDPIARIRLRGPGLASFRSPVVAELRAETLAVP